MTDIGGVTEKGRNSEKGGLAGRDGWRIWLREKRDDKRWAQDGRQRAGLAGGGEREWEVNSRATPARLPYDTRKSWRGIVLTAPYSISKKLVIYSKTVLDITGKIDICTI